MKEIINDRQKEEQASELDISVYDTERNEKAKKHRRELVISFTLVDSDNKETKKTNKTPIKANYFL